MGEMQDRFEVAILAKDGISIDILREATPDKVSLHLEPIYEETWTTALLKVNEIAKSKTHGSTHAKKLRQPEFLVETDLGNFATEKPSRSHILGTEFWLPRTDCSNYSDFHKRSV